MDLQIQFKKGALELCVLNLTIEKDYYGYELVNKISDFLDIAEGTVYPILRRLSKEGFFKTYLQESNEGPPRKYYRITPLGKERAASLKQEWEVFSSSVDDLLKGEEND
ncbi:MAG: PadR family transcriptional regulator [Bacteroidetes bacterium]|nr:PadR family transcriptional regulator [Bacteroidota bacterium]